MVLFTVLVGCPLLAQADVITDWKDAAGQAARAACNSPGADPLHESRMYAMAHLAIHDALNAIDRRFRPYALDIHARARISTEAAVAATARDVLVAVLGQIPATFPPTSGPTGAAVVEARFPTIGSAPPARAVRWRISPSSRTLRRSNLRALLPPAGEPSPQTRGRTSSQSVGASGYPPTSVCSATVCRLLHPDPERQWLTDLRLGREQPHRRRSQGLLHLLSWGSSTHRRRGRRRRLRGRPEQSFVRDSDKTQIRVDHIS